MTFILDIFVEIFFGTVTEEKRVHKPIRDRPNYD